MDPRRSATFIPLFCISKNLRNCSLPERSQLSPIAHIQVRQVSNLSLLHHQGLAPNRSRLGVLFLRSRNWRRALANSACVDKHVQFGHSTNLSFDFALCPQKSYQDRIKSTHAERPCNQMVMRVYKRWVCLAPSQRIRQDRLCGIR